MKKNLFLIIIFSIEIVFSQTITWDSNNKILTFTATKKTDIVYDYPTEINGDAIDYYNKAVNTTNTNPNLAVEYYLKSIEIYPQFVQAYDNLGQLFRALKEYELSIECYQKSISVYPQGHIAHINLATLFNTINKSDDAIKHYQKVIQIQPESPEGYYGIAKIFLDKDNLNSALEYAKKALNKYKQKPNKGIEDCYSLIGLIYYYSGIPGEAKTNIQIAKSKYVEYNIEEVFNSTFPEWLLTELSIK